VLWLGAGVARAEGDAAPTLDAVMAHFAASRGVVAVFREEKSLPLLAEPLRSEGVLYYAPPGRMVRFTHSPERTSLLLDGQRLRMEDSLGVEEIDLSAHEDARQFVDQLLVLFAGDLPALRRRYEIDFSWQRGTWSLRLAPKSLRVRGAIQEIALEGRDRALREMVVHGSAGEVTRTAYARVDVDRPFTEEELAALFPQTGAPRPLREGDGASTVNPGASADPDRP
jgi:hypothetical protein